MAVMEAHLDWLIVADAIIIPRLHDHHPTRKPPHSTSPPAHATTPGKPGVVTSKGAGSPAHIVIQLR